MKNVDKLIGLKEPTTRQQGERKKKTHTHNGFSRQNNNFARASYFFEHAFLCRHCTATTWNCPLLRLRKQATTKFYFSFWTWILSLEFQLWRPFKCSTPFGTFLCRPYTTRMGNFLSIVRRFMENLNTRRKFFLSASKPGLGTQEFNSRRISRGIRLHLTFLKRVGIIATKLKKCPVLFYVGRVCIQIQSFNNSENDTIKLSVNEVKLTGLRVTNCTTIIQKTLIFKICLRARNAFRETGPRTSRRTRQFFAFSPFSPPASQMTI